MILCDDRWCLQRMRWPQRRVHPCGIWFQLDMHWTKLVYGA
jgi:hypothetical protein